MPQWNKLTLPSERPGVMNGMSGHPPRKKITLKECFTINSENKITVHSSRKVARETGRVFATDLPGVKPVAKFTHRKIASEGVWKVLLEFGELRGARTETQPIPESTGESAASAVADQPGEAATTAGGAKVPDAGPQEPRVAPAKGKAGKTAQDRQEAHSGEAKTASGLALLRRGSYPRRTGVGTRRNAPAAEQP